jgi:hypothetical protein
MARQWDNGSLHTHRNIQTAHRLGIILFFIEELQIFGGGDWGGRTVQMVPVRLYKLLVGYISLLNCGIFQFSVAAMAAY